METLYTPTEKKKKHLLVLPGMYPRYPGDIFGVFVLDYISTVLPYYEVSVVAGRVVGYKETFTPDEKDPWPTYRFDITNRKIPRIIKLLCLPLWFKKSWKVLSGLKDAHLVHTHNVLFETLLGLWYSRRNNIPVVVTVHTGPFEKLMKPRIMGMLVKWVLERVDAVLVVSDEVRKQIIQAGISPRRIEVTYNPVDTDLFSISPEVRPFTRNLLFVGRLVDYKGGLRTLKAFKKISASFKDWTLTIVGDGPEMEEIKAFLDASPELKERVYLKGQLQKDAISEEMKKASVFVFPSAHETFGLVIAEAMASGLPVVVGNLTAPKEFVDEESGLLVPPNDVQEIANAMAHIIRHRDQYDAKVIRQKIVDRFGFYVFGNRLESIYKELGKQYADFVEV